MRIVPESTHPQLLLFTLNNLDPTVPHVLTVFNPTPQNVITIDAVAVDVTTDTGTSLTFGLKCWKYDEPPAPRDPTEWYIHRSNTYLDAIPGGAIRPLIRTITNVNANAYLD